MTAKALEERAQIEREIEGRTLCDSLLRTAEDHGDQPAYSDRVDGEWKTLTWAQTRQRALELAAGFIALGCQRGDRIALMLPNQSEHVLADLGALHAAAVPVTIYATFAPDQVGYVAANCRARVAVLAGADQLARWTPVLDRLPRLHKIIVLDEAVCPSGELYMTWDEFTRFGEERYAANPELVAERIAEVTPDDAVTLLYTSGTTGNPKGVVNTHRNVLFEAASTHMAGNVPEVVRSVSYLPLAHIAERVLTIYLPIHEVGHIHFCPEQQQVLGMLQEVQPTSFFGVPRVWEKMMAGILALTASQQDEERTAAVKRAMEAGRAYVESCQFGRQTPPEVAEAFKQADEEMLAPIRSLLGLGKAEATLSAAAPLPAEVGRFFAGLGIKILDVYGMTETTGAVTANTPDAFRLGTVGRPLPGMEIKIAEDGEILVRGPVNTPGYLGLPEATTALLGEGGWLHTGDIGALDEDGFLSVVDRKKELIITAGGENISPAGIEGLLVEHPIIGQALAFGDRRPYVVALLALDGEVAPAWAKARGIEVSSLAELAAHPAIIEAAGEAVAAANQRLARVQQVKHWELLPAEWTAESEELTPTLKLKRRVIHAKYADIIDSLYSSR
ncbi:MAG: AMP-dependent synthetase/ligase [Micromonosporaceae bacterium]